MNESNSGDIRLCCRSDSKLLSKAGINTPRKDNAPLLQCTHHMCPIRVHWHVKINYKEYWRVKVAITNFNYRLNYTQWTLVVQHPNLNNITQVFSFDYKPLVPYQSISECTFNSSNTAQLLAHLGRMRASWSCFWQSRLFIK